MVETSENPPQEGNNGNNDANKKTDQGPLAGFKQITQSGLALMIIIPAFILIGIMLFMQGSAVNQAITHINTTTTGQITNNTPNTIQALTNFYQQVNASNQNMFAIILTVFGTWVGAVVAFYFGTQNLKQSQESFNKVQDNFNKVQDHLGTALNTAIASQSQPKVTYKTVKEMLDAEPVAKDVVTVTMKDKVGVVKEKFNSKNPDVDNVLVVDEENYPIAILYEIDFVNQIKARLDVREEDLDDKPLEDVVERITSDSAIRLPWVKGGIKDDKKNFARLDEYDTPDTAHQKMEKIGGNDVRGVVFSENDNPIGIVSFQMVSASRGTT
jgi:hypothetical protein